MFFSHQHFCTGEHSKCNIRHTLTANRRDKHWQLDSKIISLLTTFTLLILGAVTFIITQVSFILGAIILAGVLIIALTGGVALLWVRNDFYLPPLFRYTILVVFLLVIAAGVAIAVQCVTCQ